jgi:hypothetical protein
MKLRPVGLFGFAAILLASVYSSAAFAQEHSNPPVPTAAASDQAASNPSQTTAPDSAPAPAATKRVWTNDDIGDLHRNSTISTFSETANKPSKANDKPVAAKSADAKRYQDQITTLQAKIPPLDDKIAQLQAVLSGNTVKETRTVGGAHIDDWHEELVKLQKQRDDIETRISSLQDEARHKGVPENQIPQ